MFGLTLLYFGKEKKKKKRENSEGVCVSSEKRKGDARWSYLPSTNNRRSISSVLAWCCCWNWTSTSTANSGAGHGRRDGDGRTGGIDHFSQAQAGPPSFSAPPAIDHCCSLPPTPTIRHGRPLLLLINVVVPDSPIIVVYVHSYLL